MLNYYDQLIFKYINTQLHSPAGDVIIPFFREKLFWLPLYVFVVTYILYHYKKNAYPYLLGLALTVLVSDTISSKIIKPYIHRTRPCNDEFFYENVKLLVYCGRGFSFPSSHATNHFAVATFLGFTIFKRRWQRWAWWSWALMIAFSQVYVGVHYPIDILAGTILGIAVGLLLARYINYYFRLL